MTTKAQAARRSAIIRELANLSRGGWHGARPVDYRPLELELEQLESRS